MSTATIAPTDVLDSIRELLDQGRVEDALQLINRRGQKSAAIENARGVCLLRLGKYQQALATFRDLVFPGGSFGIDPETPTVFQTNYVTALLTLNNVVVARSILDQIEDKHHPAAVRLRSAIGKWKKSLGPLRAMLLLVGAYPDTPVRLDFPPGDI